jgi:hypothetical protein
MPTWDSDEAIKIVPRGRTVFGDGHVAISLLRGGKHGVIFAEMSTPGVPGSQADLRDAVPFGAWSLEIANVDAVDRVIGVLEVVKAEMLEALNA